MSEPKQIDSGSVRQEHPLDSKDEPVVNSSAATGTSTCPIENDHHSWLLEQIHLIRSRQYERIDWDNVAEELEDVASSERRAPKSDLEILLQHLLKLQYESRPNEWRRHSRGWKLSVAEHRNRMADILEDSASLRKLLKEVLPKVYSRGMQQASIATGLPESKFPKQCPWSVQQIMEMRFPDPFGIEAD